MSTAVYPAKLLAKSKTFGREVTLQQHLQQTAEAADLIFTTSERVGRNYLNAFRIPADEWNDFQRNLAIACLLHDIGKANESFLAAIAHRGDQVIRHEHLSAIFMMLPYVQEWLRSGDSLNLPVILGAVLSHHLKAEDERSLGVVLGTVDPSTQLYFDHDEVKRIMELIAVRASLTAAPTVPLKRFNRLHAPWSDAIIAIERIGRSVGRACRARTDHKLRQHLAAVKAALIVADSVASAVVREGLDLKAWITETIHSERLTKSELVSQVIEQRKRNIETRTKKIFAERDFQLTVAQQPERSVVTAGCGTGKTLASLLWCAEQLDRAEYGRVIFLYPTRGTATEGFRDYIGWAPDDEASLLHSSAEYELLAMLENPSDATDGKDYRESQQRLFALASYPRRYFSATVDQFLGFLAHDYGGLCRLPLLTDSVVVIDEVHSFDTKLLESLLQFLESFNIPVLCMTATLQPSRRKALEDLYMKVFPEPSDRASLVELEAQESHPRYAIEWINDEIEALRIAKSAVGEGERVLWVVNTVNRCQQIAQQLAGLPTIVYHSRFKLGDRTHQHKLCVASFTFDAGPGGIIALTTQVCEMSLDLDADRLITECAPSEALIQRFGRANRHSGNRPSGFLAPIHVYKPATEKPYDREDINGGAKLVDQAQFATVGGASQKQLADILLQCSPPGISPQPNARFFDSGIYAARGEFRDIDEYTVPCILDADLPVAQDLIKRKRPLDELIVPVPEFRAREPKPLWLPGYLRVALSSAYSPELGFTA